MPVRSTRERIFGTLISLLVVAGIGWGTTRSARHDASRTSASLAALEAEGIRQPRVQVEDGEATVFGHAASSRQRDAALRAVGRVDGVRHVTDRLAIDRPTDDAPPPDGSAESESEPDTPTLLPATPTKPAPAGKTDPPAPRSASRAKPPSSAPSAPPVSSEPTTGPCAIPGDLRGRSVVFESVSATVQGTSVNLLAAVASHLRDCPEHLLEVRAYADQAGSAEANLVLSRQRAQAVVGHLTHQGISADRLVATYRGSRSPGGNQALVTIHSGGAR